MIQNSDVTAIIVSYNHKPALKELLQMLLTHQEYRDLSILVVDNGSTDGSLDMIKDFQSRYNALQLFEEPENRGGAGGFRRGISEALKQDRFLFWLLDDDALPRPDALYELLKAARAMDTPWGALGSLIAQQESPDRITELGGNIAWFRGKLIARKQNKKISSVEYFPPERVGHCAAASLLIPRTVVEKCGIFEDMFIHFDDAEWCYRVARAGYELFSVPASVVLHPFKRKSTPPWIRYYDARNILFLYKRHCPFLIFIPRLRFLLMSLVFRLKKQPLAARLIRMGQKDFLKNRLRLRHELPQE